MKDFREKLYMCVATKSDAEEAEARKTLARIGLSEKDAGSRLVAHVFSRTVEYERLEMGGGARNARFFRRQLSYQGFADIAESVPFEKIEGALESCRPGDENAFTEHRIGEQKFEWFADRWILERDAAGGIPTKLADLSDPGNAVRTILSEVASDTKAFLEKNSRKKGSFYAPAIEDAVHGYTESLDLCAVLHRYLLILSGRGGADECRKAVLKTEMLSDGSAQVALSTEKTERWCGNAAGDCVAVRLSKDGVSAAYVEKGRELDIPVPAEVLSDGSPVILAALEAVAKTVPEWRAKGCLERFDNCLASELEGSDTKSVYIAVKKTMSKFNPTEQSDLKAAFKAAGCADEKSAEQFFRKKAAALQKIRKAKGGQV